MFLQTNLSARRKLLFLMLTLCCLTQTMSAKITKRSTTKTPTTNAPKVEDYSDNDNKEQIEGESEEEEESASASAVISSDVNKEKDKDDNVSNNDVVDDDDDNDEDDEQQAQQILTTALKNALPEGWASSSFASTVNSLWSWIGKGLSESFFGDNDTKDSTAATVTGRTFGKIRRLQMALIPIIFKFGILTAMVAFLVAIGMKSLFLIKVLIFMNAIAILGKFLTLKTSLGQLEHSAPPFNYNGWNPHVHESSWAHTAPAAPFHTPSHPSKEIHLHIHGAGTGAGGGAVQPQVVHQGYNYDSQGWQKRVDPYAAYAPNVIAQSDVQNEVTTNTDPMSLLPTKYSARYLAY